MWFEKKYILQVQNGYVNFFLMLNAMQNFDDSRVLFMDSRTAYLSFHSQKKNSIFFVFFMFRT